MACQHPDFTARVDVFRLSDQEGEDVHAFDAEITVRCVDCGAPFGWRGVRSGLSPAEPRRDPRGLTLRAPLLSPTDLASMGELPGLAPDPPVPPRPGYDINVRQD